MRAEVHPERPSSVNAMDVRIFVEPQQGATYEQQLAVAQTAEAHGFTGFFRSDHYLKMGDVTGMPGPTDTWVTLGGIARETTTIRLGTLVCSATFRLPGPLAVAVAQVDNMSGGRVELGMGAGWFDTEHTAYGVPFPTTKVRFQMMEEQLQILTGMWRAPVDGEFSFEGQHYTVVGSPALPKPTQPGGPPILIGGYGARTTPRLAATYASEFNVPFPPLAAYPDLRDNVRRACDAMDRPHDDLVWSVALVVCVGQTDVDVARRAQRIGRQVDELKENGAAGSPAEVLDKLASFAELGVDRIYLQLLDIDDVDQVAEIGNDVVAVLP